MDSTSEKTRSDAAELAVIAKMIRAALAHVGIVGWLTFHHFRSSDVYSWTLAVLNPPRARCCERQVVVALAMKAWQEVVLGDRLDP